MTTQHLDNLKLRLKGATGRDVVNLVNAIAKHEARMAELPAALSEETRDEITMWEGQIEVNRGRYDLHRDRDIDAIKARIAALMATAAQQSEAA